MRDECVGPILRAQYGIITRRQALDAGLTDRQIRHRASQGQWMAVHRGVYRHCAVGPSWHNEMLAGCFATAGLASHRGAGALHGIDGIKPIHRELVVPHGSWRPLVGLRVHQSTQMDRAEPVARAGIPCTGLARTALDLGAVMSTRRLGAVVDSLVREKRLDMSDLVSVLISHARRGRNGVGPMREVLEERRGEVRLPLSNWSRDVARLFVDHGLPQPVLEHRVTRADGSFVAQVDLSYPDRRIAIELDSVTWHFNLDSFIEDRRRWNRVVTAGWTVLNFSWSDFVDRPRAAVEEVRAAIFRSHDRS